MKPLSHLEIPVRSPDQLGNALARYRKHIAWTQQKLGERAGVKQEGISVVEHGAPGVRVGTLFKLLAALDLEIIIRKRRKSGSEA